MNHKVSTLIAGILLVTATVQCSFAQSAFEKHSVLINGGVSLHHEDAAPAGSVEYALCNQLGVGFRSTYSRTGNGYNIFNGAVYTNYHFANLNRFDPFAGLMLDKTYYVNNIRKTEPSSQPFNLNVQAGLRYLFTKRFGVYGQAVMPFRKDIGFGGEVGLSVKL